MDHLPQFGRIKSLLFIMTISGLTGCGGGGDSSAASSPPPVSSAATISGTAATGAAIVNGMVSLKCVSGTTRTTRTGNDGSFSLDVTGATLPCLAQIDYVDAVGTSKKLHSFVSAAGTVNITPITELLVAKLANSAATTAFDNFNPSQVQSITPTQITAAITVIKNYFISLSVDTANLPSDPIRTQFVIGDSSDKVLDDLKVKLNAVGKTLDDAVTIMDGTAVPQTHYLYTVKGMIYNQPSPSPAANAGSVSQYTIGVNGSLSLTSSFSLPSGGFADSVDIDRAGKYAYISASGNSSGDVIYQYTVNADGSLKPNTIKTVSTTLIGSWSSNFVFDSSNKYAYKAGLIGNPSVSTPWSVINIYSVGSDGSLSFNSTINVAQDGAEAKIIVDAVHNVLYRATYSGAITAYSIGVNGALTAISSPLVLPAIADIVIDPTGKYLYATLKGSTPSSAGSVHEYVIGANGELSPMAIPSVMVGVDPRQLTIDASAKYAYVTNQGDNTISEFSIGLDGALTPLTTSKLSTVDTPQDISANPMGGNMYVSSSFGPIGGIFSGNITSYNIGSGGVLGVGSAINITSTSGAIPFVKTH